MTTKEIIQKIDSLENQVLNYQKKATENIFYMLKKNRINTLEMLKKIHMSNATLFERKKTQFTTKEIKKIYEYIATYKIEIQ